ncbi:biotin--protein ligase [Leguminivora glycinivorella]|uniref:biotin--protein ligase n=1 Tax=Leguminivora glycinivorella TaxID=1035111 RepID=UPI00200E79CA|nr:biotin--protein ligase [Leguminivora glycinivorella]XP_047988410.1 biotin--protein ligase [Leguminivora glycinivorella]
MLFTPIYIAMTFIKTWRIRSFRARLLEFLSGNTSVAFCKVPENAAETPTLSSKLCTNPKNAYLCDLLDYTNATRICSMKPAQCIEISDWVTCAGGLPLGSDEQSPLTEFDVEVLLECEMEPHDLSANHLITLDSMGLPVAWKASSHLAIVLKTNIENLSAAGFHFVGSDEFLIDHKLPVVRIQTVKLTGEPNKATDASMRSLRSDIQHGLKNPPGEFHWPVHAALLRKLSKVVDVKSECNSAIVEMNGGSSNMVDTTTISKRTVSLADVSVNTTKSLTEEDEKDTLAAEPIKTPNKSPERKAKPQEEIVVENVTVEIQHNITPKKSSLKLDLKKGTSCLSASLLNISSQIKSVTTHKRIVSSSGPKKSQPQIESCPAKEDSKGSPSHGTLKSAKTSRPLVNTKSPNILIYSDSIAARDNLEASLRKVLDADRYTIYSVTRDALETGAWRGRCALVAVAGCVGRAAPLLLAHLLDGGRLLALCSDLLHAVLPYYKTAEVRENEVVQFTFDKWKSVKMKHHIFCYQASPAKKQFSTESDRQPSKYTGHPGHELDIQVLASEETWRTPSLLQATDLTNSGVAIFSQIHLEADPSDYLAEEGVKSNEARLEIIHKILGDILDLHVRDPRDITQPEYTRGFFLGNHVQKLALVERWWSGAQRLQALPGLTLQWCLRGDAEARAPAADFLPVHVYECPDHFSTVEYFDNLSSKELGRLVIYADMLTSTNAVTNGPPLAHGVAAVARRQSTGQGRGSNAWISVPGQASMSLQVWCKVSPTLPLVQHAAALAAVRAIRALPAYEHLDIRIKWPNDIYYGREVKIGGTATTANVTGENVVCNIGTGVNISNIVPTTCVNQIIEQHNKQHGTTLAPMTIEKFLARYCSQLERILEYIDSDGGVDAFREQYYQYWLHDNEKIQVRRSGESSPIPGTVVGVDEAGWLRVLTAAGDVTVAPDGNTFDLMTGLVAPRL